MVSPVGELRNPKDFIAMDVGAKMASVNVCPEMCLKLWKGQNNA